MTASNRYSTAIVDAFVWLALPALLFFSLRIGRLSGDGLVQTHDYLTQSWRLNPNHLLYEPLGAAWLRLILTLRLARPAVDQMLLLSVTAGAITVGLFRVAVASIASTRTAANEATAWVAFSAAFMGLWLSSEAQMVQMPFLVLSFWGALRYATKPSLLRAILAGCAIGIATLFYVSNVLLAGSIPLALGLIGPYIGRRYQRIQLFTIVGSATAVAAAGLLLAWLATAAGTVSLFEWLSSYGGGGRTASRIAASYGVHGLAELPTAIARAIYGTAMGLVDISPAVGDVRTHGSITATSLAAVAVCLTTFSVLGYGVLRAQALRKPKSLMLLIILAWLAAIFTFGVFWNNSDDQFYFQMSIAFGAMVAICWTPQTRKVLAVATTLLVGWNGASAWRELINYPRDKYVHGLAATTAGAGLVIFPGSDEIMQLMYFVPGSAGQRRINLTSVAGTKPPAVGLQSLVTEVDCALSANRSVVMLDIATPGAGDSWRALSGLGYPRDRVMKTLERYKFVEPTQIGPFVAHRLVPYSPIAPSTCRSGRS